MLIDTFMKNKSKVQMSIHPWIQCGHVYNLKENFEFLGKQVLPL